LDVAKEFSTKGSYQQILENFDSLDYYDAGIHEMFQADFMEQQLCFLHQLDMYDDLQYPTATYMEIVFSWVPNIVEFNMQSYCSSKYKLPIKFLFQKLHYLCTLSFSCKQEEYVVN
jgi:hypothetical protein